MLQKIARNWALKKLPKENFNIGEYRTQTVYNLPMYVRADNYHALKIICGSHMEAQFSFVDKNPTKKYFIALKTGNLEMCGVFRFFPQVLDFFTRYFVDGCLNDDDLKHLLSIIDTFDTAWHQYRSTEGIQTTLFDLAEYTYG